MQMTNSSKLCIIGNKFEKHLNERELHLYEEEA